MGNSVDCVIPRENSQDRDFGTKSNKTNQNLCNDKTNNWLQVSLGKSLTTLQKGINSNFSS